MQHVTIRLCDLLHPRHCPACGQQHVLSTQGPHLFLEAHNDPLCRGCGKKIAPTMAALLDLAVTAERVGRRCRHLLTPPMESLLDLARAAENYSDAAPCVRSSG